MYDLRGLSAGLQRTAALCVLVASGSLAAASEPTTPDETGQPLLWKRIELPEAVLAEHEHQGQLLSYGGDVRLGDLTGDGRADLVVFRSTDGGMKPCFLAAVDDRGKPLWKVGQGGQQPTRPGPVAAYDLNADGATEVLCLFAKADEASTAGKMNNVVVQLRRGSDGALLRQNAPEELRRCKGKGPNWVHHRLLVANLRGKAQPQDFIVKLGDTILAIDDRLQVLWTYRTGWNEYSRCSAYIPSVGDIDGDGRDEVNGGYFLLDEDGTPRWEAQLGRHMDSVAIVPWDHGRMRAICSGFGHVVDAEGNVILKLGADVVPHGQEARVADFLPELPGPEMVLRYNGHRPDVLVVANDGRVVKRFELNDSPNHTGMEAVYWNGPDRPAVLYNGGVLFRGDGSRLAALPGLPEPVGPPKMGWYHCIPADVCGDKREEVVVYNPWDRFVAIYTPAPLRESAFEGYAPAPRQYNVRLMD
jgi:hypothetical protein